MGYTVYFEQNRPFTLQEWGDIRAAVIPMFHRLKQIKGESGYNRPTISNDTIGFNGDASKGEDHESFILGRTARGFQFCKTARKPYDRFVKAVLIIANFYAPGALKVSCDGDDEPDCWTEGVRIASIYAKGLREGCSPCSPLEQVAPKSTEIAHSDPYNGVYTEIDEAIELLTKIGKGNKVHSFLANYLKANIDDIKDAYTPA
jgi:hypothetical protein